MNDTEANPLLQPWDAPFGLPPFECLRPGHFASALEEAMRRNGQHDKASDRSTGLWIIKIILFGIITSRRMGINPKMRRLCDGKTIGHAVGGDKIIDEPIIMRLI